ncbi:MAG: hypothetical protein IPK19_15460 [Chloroflexi bacterium]|nr:hypothetical protein [Chloroflexota bacterium]
MQIYPYRYAPNAEVSGVAMSAIFNHARREEVLDSLQRFGLEYLEPDQWYPVDQFINMFAEWFQSPAVSTNLISVGMAMIYHMELPEIAEKESSIDKLLLLGDLHSLYHRNGDVGGYSVEMVSPNTIRFTENIIWPDDMIYGYLYGAAQHFFGRGVHFVLRYADDHVRQEMGGETTVFELTWE